MDLSNTAAANGMTRLPGRTGFLPLNSWKLSGMYALPDRNSGIPLQRDTGKAIPLKREKTALPLNAGTGSRDIDAEKAKLRKAAEGFEAIFIRQLLKTMRSTVSEGNLYGSGSTGEMYGDMVESSLSDALAKKGSFGIANSVYNQLVRRIGKPEAAGNAGPVPESTETVIPER
jgi:peptidoglycan hydrolase FlgJ